MIKQLLLALSMLALPASANPPIFIFLDGVMIGTMSVFEYRLSDNIIWIETNELIFGCEQALIFNDRFEE